MRGQLLSLQLTAADEAVLLQGGGGPKAFYAYPAEHYVFWQTVRAQAGVAAWDAPVPHGTLGEQLTLSGLLENQAYVGDVLRFPECELAVSQPRLPDDAVNRAMGFAHAASLMASSAWSGFHLAVLKPGRLQAGQAFELVPGPREVEMRALFLARLQPSRAEPPKLLGLEARVG